MTLLIALLPFYSLGQAHQKSNNTKPALVELLTSTSIFCNVAPTLPFHLHCSQFTDNLQPAKSYGEFLIVILFDISVIWHFEIFCFSWNSLLSWLVRYHSALFFLLLVFTFYSASSLGSLFFVGFFFFFLASMLKAIQIGHLKCVFLASHSLLLK